MPCPQIGGCDTVQMSALPTWILGSIAIPTQTQQDTEMVSKCLQEHEKGKHRNMSCHPILRLTRETHYQDSVAQTEGPTHRTVEQTERCGKPTNTHPQVKPEEFFLLCRNLWPRAHQASSLPLGHTPARSLTADKDAEVTGGKTVPSVTIWRPIGKRQREVLRDKRPYFVHSPTLSTSSSERHLICARSDMAILNFVDYHFLARCATESPKYLT